MPLRPALFLRRLAWYGAALVGSGLALLARGALTGSIGPGFPPYITFYPMVMLVATCCGGGPGVLATVASALLVDYWILPPLGSLRIAAWDDAIGMALFLVFGSGMSLVAELYRRARDQAARYAADLAVRTAEAQAATRAEEAGRAHALALEASEARYRTLVDHLPIGVFLADPTGRILMANPAARRLSRLPAGEDAVGRHIAEFQAPEERPQARALFHTAMQVGGDPRFDGTVLRADGTRLSAELSGAVVKDAAGQPVAFMAMAQDISARKRTEAEAAARSAIWRIFLETEALEATYQRLAEALTAHLGFAIAAVELYDAAREEMVFEGVSGMEDVPPGTRVPASQTLSGVVAMTGRPVSDSHAGGHMGSVHEGLRQLDVQTFICVPFHSGDAVAGVLVLADRTPREDAAAWMQNLETIAQTLSLEISRRHALEALHASEAQLAAVFRGSPVGLYVSRMADGRMLLLNAAFARLYGYPEAEMLNRTGAELGLWAAPADRDRFFAALRADGRVTGLEVEVVTRAGARRTVLLSAELFRLGGEPCFLGVTADITARKQAEAALRESEGRFRALVEGAPEAVFVQSEGRFQYVNQAMVALVGATRAEDLVGESTFARIAQEFHDRIRARIRAQRETGAPAPPMEQEYLRLDGTRVPVETTAVPIRFRDQDAHLVFVRDSTERRAAEAARASLEAQLRQAQKMESVGRLAGGVAHDLNNLLVPILGYGELLQDELAPGDERQELASEICAAARRARDLVRQLLAFSRRQPIELRPVDLTAVVGGVEKLLRRTLREDVALQRTCAAALPPIRADIGQLEQVLMNLAVNAQDAMPTGGRLTITTARVTLAQSRSQADITLPAGPAVRLTVTDTGTGMDAATCERIFEPFFTTKGLGRGTGLGLSTVYGIVQQHGGLIDVASTPGQGTTFTLTFPPAERTPPVPPPAPVRPAAGGGTVLLAEDNPGVRGMVAHMLRQHGYTVLAGMDGADCLRCLEAYRGPLDLLLTDVVMPDMSGTALAAAVATRRPGTPVLYMSGYPDEAIAPHGVLAPGTHFIQKPFTGQDLLAKLQEVLGPAGGLHST